MIADREADLDKAAALISAHRQSRERRELASICAKADAACRLQAIREVRALTRENTRLRAKLFALCRVVGMPKK